MGTNPAQGAAAGTYTTVELLNSDGTVGSNNFDVFKNDQEDNHMTGEIGLIGLGKLRKYFNRLMVGNLNDGGVQINEVMSEFGGALYKDDYAVTVLGDADNMLAVYPGLSQFFSYNNFKGDFNLNTPDSSIKTTIKDPLFGFDWDFILKYDDECSTGNGINGAWTGRVLLYFDLWQAPSAAFGGAYGDLAGFNGTVGYKVTQA